MIGYNPSHLNKNETLLEAFHRVEAYLKANPQYQVYQSSAQYQEGTQEYALNTIVVPEGSTVGAGDVVLFSNGYYAVITKVSELTFYVEYATTVPGTPGPQGPKGEPGTNPNLLINPNFAINQRGKTSYTGNDVYTVDRWLVYGATLTPVSNGVSLECNGNSRVFQRIEHNNELWGKSVTLTFCIDGTKKSASATFPTTIPTENTYILATEYDSNGYRLRITYYTSGILAVLLDCNQTKTIVVNWAKLEIGSVATEFSPPSIAEELIKCQRYYIKIGDAYPYITSGFVTSGGKGYRMALYLPTTMRDTPSVGGTPTWLARNSNGYSTYTGSSAKSFTSAKVAPLGGSAYRIVDSLSAAGGDTNNTIFAFDINKLELDAEI